jgi:2Fe-2S ferredoxin
MARVKFEPSGFETDVKPGIRFVDVTDEYPEADVPYSCRSASCGTCRVEVKEGLAAMRLAEADEQEVLDLFGDGPTIRLCCQLRLEKDTDEIVLRVVEPM